LYVAINKRLSQPLDESDPGFAYAVWSQADEQYDSWLRAALTEEENDERSFNETKRPFNCWLEMWEIDARKNDQVNQIKVEEKLVGLYFYDNEPEEGE
jgi:hypothetical protein